MIKTPSAEQIVFDLELIQNLSHRLVDEIHDGLGGVIKGRHRREYHPTHFHNRRHVAQVA